MRFQAFMCCLSEGESADRPTEVTAVEAEDKDQTIAIPATANNEVNITVVATGNPQQNASLETPTCAANVGVTPGGIILTPGGEICKYPKSN